MIYVYTSLGFPGPEPAHTVSDRLLRSRRVLQVGEVSTAHVQPVDRMYLVQLVQLHTVEVLLSALVVVVNLRLGATRVLVL